MNIILRPGGGDRAKALPRPKVEVNSEGSNVIVVKLTFPDNENIQGLRAFTPTDPKDLEKFAELRRALSAEDTSVERLTAISSEEENFIDTTPGEDHPEAREEEAEESELENLVVPVSNPTRPPRPYKAKRPPHSYLPPPGAPLPLSRPSSSYLPPVGAEVPRAQNGFLFKPPAKNRNPKKVINFMDKKKDSFFRFKQISEEIGSSEVKRIKPRQPQDQPPLTPSSFERSSKEVLAFKPSEAFNEEEHLHAAFPQKPSRPPRPPRPPKPIKIVNDNQHPPRPQGPPPKPKGPPPQRLPHRGVQLTKNGKRHPGIIVQQRLDSVPSRSYYPILQNAWKGLSLL